MRNIKYIIAGASTGTGKFICKHLADQGIQVFAIARSFECSKVDNIEYIKSDATEWDNINSVLKKIAIQDDSSYCLVNCIATWTGGRAIRDMSATYFEESMKLNLYSSFNLIKAFLENFNYSINLTSSYIQLGATASHRGSAGMSAFACAKSATRILLQSLSREESQNGLHISHITIDGLIRNPRTEELNPDLASDKYISMFSLAKEIQHIANQTKDAWSFEVEMRPYNEQF